MFQFITRLLDGGAEAHLIETVRHLDKYDVTVGHGAFYHDSQVERLEREGVTTEVFPLVRHYNPVTAVPAVFSVAQYLRRNDFDIVHTNSTEAGIIGRFAAAIADVPVVVHTVHGVPFADDRNALLNRFVLACERLAARHTDQIVTNADVMAEAYLDRGIGTLDQYATIPSGVDLEPFRDASPAEDLPGERPRVVMIGRLADGKGFDVLLDAVADIRQEASVCLVGDGPLADTLESDIETRGFSDRVFLTGYRDDVPRVLAASDVLVLPSFREGTPRVITEAMAAGLPVVATDIAGIPKQVEHGESGYLIPPGDDAALADRLNELLADPQLRERFGRRGSERATRFSVEAMVDATTDLYESLLSASRVHTGR
ncbi:Glycosyltransferase [Halapricum desulfuricans]|uniref:Glycosyltransferase n=1 Tax=Halapricum desulfuricans TaxID=2841257 RepID=A0A897N1B5_9EURY|nr:Glycosyltransferase [Halapricum desulfuricans]